MNNKGLKIMMNLTKTTVIFTLLMVFTTSVLAGDALETNSVLTIERKVLEKGKKYGKKNVLVVFDIDNTLMAMSQNFGSDQWWTWQSNNCMKKKAPSFCVTNKFSELLDIQGQIFALSNMKPSEKTTPRVVRTLQKRGYKIILLTSRGPEFRSATQRALKMNNFDFSHSAIGPKGGFPSTFKPYMLDNPQKYGLTKEDMKLSGNRKPRRASYMNGLFMTAGMNKGIMLKALLHKTNSKFKAIVFADDHIKHTKRMQQILGNSQDLDLTTYRYGAIDSEVKKFKASDKKDVKEAWNNFKKLRNKAFKL